MRKITYLKQKNRKTYNRSDLSSSIIRKIFSLLLAILFVAQIIVPFTVSSESNSIINSNNGPAKAAPTGDLVEVSNWKQLTDLGSEADGVFVISRSCTIKLTEDLVATSPIKITGNVHISADTNKTIYRQKGNTDFTVFTVDNNGVLTLGENVTMTGEIAENHTKAFKITVTDAYGAVLYEETVYEDETRTPKQILQQKNYYTKDKAQALIKDKTENDPDSPYSLGYQLQDTPWDMAGYDDTPMKDVNGDLLIVAKWNNPDPNKVLHVVDGYGNEIYRVEVPAKSSKTARQLMHEAVINGTTYNIEDDNNGINTVLNMKLASVSDGPFALGFKFKEWNFATLGMQPFSNHPGDFYVVAVWDNPDYVITLTDGYGAVLKTIDVAYNDNRTPLQILTELGINDNTQEGREAMMALIKSKTESNPNSPYSLGYTLRTNPLPWEMSGFRNQSMSTDVRGNLLIKAMWVAPDKQLKLKVTDGAGNVIFESTDKSKTIQQLMTDNGLNANAANQSAAEKTAIANKVGSSAESPANDNNYSFKEWDFGGVDKSQTLTQIDGNVVVCAAWNPPGEVEYVWEVPDPIEEGREIEIGSANRFIGMNPSEQTEWYNDFGSDNKKWVIANVQGNTFEIVNKSDTSKKMWVKASASNGGTVQYDGGFRYSTGAFAQSNIYTRFYFVTEGDNTYLACDGVFQDYNAQTKSKTVYLIDNPSANGVFFWDNKSLGVAIHVGKPTKKYANPDTPGKSDVPGPGTPTGTPDQAGVTRANPVDKDDDDAAGRHNIATGETPQTTKTQQNAGRSQASGVDSFPINANSIKPALYRKDAYDTNQSPYRQKFASSNKGFFVKVNSGGTFDLQGATLHNFNTVSYNANMPTGVAPVYVDGGTLNMRSGRITNNSVSYSPTDNNNDGIEDRSGDYVNGGNRNTWSYVAPERNATAQPDPKPTKTAGAIIFTNKSKGSITGTASLDHNKADSGALIVQGDSIVVLGGIYNPNGEEDSTSNPIIDNSLGGGHIDSNVGFHYSGGALLEDGGTLIMAASDSTMNSNVSWNKGGAVWATEFGTHGDGYGVRKGGGVVYNINTGRWLKPDGTPNPGKFIMLDGLMQYNTAFHRGGAINVESDYVILKGGEISYNNCRALGGAIYVEGDFADYNYTLKISEGYIGHNYAVNQNPDEQNRVIDNVGGYLDGKTLAEANDILDRKIVEDLAGYTGNNSASATWIANPSANTGYDSHSKPLSESSISDKTADQHVWTRYRAGASMQGNGGGLWLCPLGSTAVFNLNEEHEVYVDDNYASSWKATDDRPGTDIYLLPGDGHVIAKQMHGEIWINEKTGGKVPEENDSNIYSGHQGFKNVTTDENDSADHQYNQNKANVGGIKIVNNLSRDGGGIAANGTVIFGAPTDVFRHEAEMTLNKTWTNREIPHNITFKLFYMPENYQSDEDLIPLEGYEFTLTGSQTPEDEYSIIQESSSVVKNGNTIWSATFKIPTTVNIETVINGVNSTVPYPLYKLIDPENPSRLLSPSSQEDAGRIVELLLNGHKKLEIDQSSWRIVIKEFDANGEEITNSYFSDVWAEQFGKRDLHIGVTGSVGQELDQEGYNIKFSLARFEQEVINTNETIEKYINNVVHEELYSYDEKFEYEIMTYVPIDATEVIIYDTLEDSLMFVTNTDVEQFDSDGNLNNAFQTERNRSRNFYMIKNDSNSNMYQLVVFDENDHIGDGSGTVAANSGFTVFSNNISGGMGTNPMNAGNVIIGNAPADPNNVEDLPAENISGNTLYVKIDENSSIAAVRGKWVRVKFYAAIKPQYRELHKIHNSENGWISKEEPKQGEIDNTILGRLDKYLESNNETVTRLRKKNNRYYAKTSGGKYYQFCIDGDGQWWKTELAGGQTKYTSTSGQVRTTNNNTIYDDANRPLEGYYKTLGVFNEAPNQHPSWVGEDADFNELRGGYNYPVIEAMEPHSGVKNQADYIVKRGHKPDSSYKSNIVTVDVTQPEKYVNGKIHEILGANDDYGYFDSMVEYTILVYVPDDADSLQIYDTLEDDMMFVDYLGNTQYKTYSVGTDDGNGGLISEDVLNPAFKPNDTFTSDGTTTEIKNRMITNNSQIKENGVVKATNIYYLTVKDSNDHKGDGTGTASNRSGVNVTHLNDPVVGSRSSYIKVGNLINNSDGSVSVDPNNEGKTILIHISKETLDEYDRINKPIRGKWVQATFRAQIKPGSYAEIVDKISSENMYTTDPDLKDENYPDPVGYYYRLDEKTLYKENAVDPNNPTSGVHYTKGDDGKFSVRNETAYQGDGIEGVDYRLEYECDYIYFVSNANDLPSGIESTDTTKVKPVYIRQGWNDTDSSISWEYITDDGNVIDGEKLYGKSSEADEPIGVQENGDHAGLANKANYNIKRDNTWNSIATNTVTVVPKERDIQVTKIWIVKADTKLPSAEEFLDNIDLWWEYDDTNSGQHNKQVGKITELYRDHMSVIFDKMEVHGETVRYEWKIIVRDLPQLSSNMHYFLTEKEPFDGYNLPEYSQDGHAHHNGRIKNDLEDNEKYTHLTVVKDWDDGITNNDHDKSITVRLLGNNRTIYERDSQNKVVLVDGNPKEWQYSIKELKNTDNYEYEWSNLPRFQYDDNGNSIYIKNPYTLDDYHQALDGEKFYKDNDVWVIDDQNGHVLNDSEMSEMLTTNQSEASKDDYDQSIHADIRYSIELLNDPEGYILTEENKVNNQYRTREVHYLYNENIPNDGVVITKAYLYADSGADTPVLYDGTPKKQLSETELADLNETNLAGCNIKEDGSLSQLPVTPFKSYSCYLDVSEAYETYQVRLVNTKPQIEKYINKDVHLKTYLANEFTYDIIAYIPEEATEIEITDELLPTLELQSILEPVINNNLIVGYEEHLVGSIPPTIEVAIRSSNNHTVNGDVASDETDGSAVGTLTVDGNGFRLKLENIYPASSPNGNYIKDDNGEYVRVINVKNKSDVKFVKESEIEDGYEIYEVQRYRIAGNDDQGIGGKFVQVSFKAKFNLEKEELLKQWINNSKSSTTDNIDVDWDVIQVETNKGWDKYIASVLASNGYDSNAEYIIDDYGPIKDYLRENGKTIEAAITENDNYFVRTTDGEYYQYRRTSTAEDYNHLIKQWFKVFCPEGKIANSNASLIYLSGDKAGEIATKPDGVSHYWLGLPFNAIVNKFNDPSKFVDMIPIEPEEYVEIEGKYYLREVAKLYAPDYDDSSATIYRKVDWGRGDGDINRDNPLNPSQYTGNHAGVVNTASYEVTYGNKYKSNHKSNTVTVVPEIYELPSSGGMGTFLFNILGVMFMTLALTEYVLKKSRRKGY